MSSVKWPFVGIMLSLMMSPVAQNAGETKYGNPGGTFGVIREGNPRGDMFEDALDLIDDVGASAGEGTARIGDFQRENFKNKLWGVGYAHIGFNASTSPNWCRPGLTPLAKLYRFDPKFTSNKQTYRIKDINSTAAVHTYCPVDAKCKQIAPNAPPMSKRLLLASVIVHEGVHCTQSHDKQPGAPGPAPDPKAKESACIEIEAHLKQIQFIKDALSWWTYLGLIEPSSQAERSIYLYLAWLEAELENYRDIKKKNTP